VSGEKVTGYLLDCARRVVCEKKEKIFEVVGSINMLE
jgi:hypothetical protein